MKSLKDAWLQRVRLLLQLMIHLLEPRPWRWGWVKPLGSDRCWGQFRWEVVHDQAWIRFRELQRDGTFAESCMPGSSVQRLSDVQEMEVREAVLPDPDAQDRPCTAFDASSARPPLCGRCAYTRESHDARDREQEAIFDAHRWRTHVAEILQQRRGGYFTERDILLVFDGASEATPPGRDQILDVRVKQRHGDNEGERISGAEWGALMAAGLPIYPWSAAAQTWGTPTPTAGDEGQ